MGHRNATNLRSAIIKLRKSSEGRALYDELVVASEILVGQLRLGYRAKKDIRSSIDPGARACLRSLANQAMLLIPELADEWAHCHENSIAIQIEELDSKRKC